MGNLRALGIFDPGLHAVTEEYDVITSPLWTELSQQHCYLPADLTTCKPTNIASDDFACYSQRKQISLALRPNALSSCAQEARGELLWNPTQVYLTLIFCVRAVPLNCVL